MLYVNISSSKTNFIITTIIMTICENEQPLNFRDFYKGNEKSRQVVGVASYKWGR